MTNLFVGLLVIYLAVLVTFGLFTMFQRDFDNWTQKYTVGELVSIVVLWPLMLIYVALSSVPSIIEKFEDAREDGEDKDEKP